MALEPAGVSLEAQGFSNYLNKLDKIDKKQQDVFDTKFKGTGKSFSDVTKAAKKYEKGLKDLARAEQKAKQEAKALAAAQKTAAATSNAAFLATGQAVLSMAKQIATAAFELGKLGAQYQGQQTGLANLAASYGQSGRDIQKAITKASKGTISDLQAIQAANQGLLLGVAKTPAEFERLTSTALTLGRTLGLDSTQAIEQFTSALGRQSLLILDNFGISAKQVNAEMERLAQVNFGKARSELTEAQRQSVFMEAALSAAGDAAERIGDEAGNAQAAFDGLTASTENFKTALGVAISDLNKALGVSEALTRQLNMATEGLQASAGRAEGATLDEQIRTAEIEVKNLANTLEDTRASLEGEGGFSLLEFFGLGGVGEALDEAAIETQVAALAELQAKLDDLNLQKAAEDAKIFSDNMDDTPPIIEDNTEAIKAYASAIKQAEDLQLSFARAAEDAALKLARANEDIARKQAKAVADLEGKQKKAREKLLDDQIKQLADFEKDREKQIAKAEKDVQKARKEASEKRKRDQEKLHRDLKREQERFNLSQLQSERRFKLSESRLRAEGDILALKELREDRALERQEEKENFDLSKKEQIDSAKEQQREQQRDLEDKVKELKEGLEEQRAELLASFDEQLQAQQEAQAEATSLQQQKFADDKVERDIALAREEEDRRISQQRQLEDLGRSFAEQEGVTVEGTEAIAAQLEKIFGIEGTASNIMTGFTTKTENDFTKLFAKLEDIVNGAKLEPKTSLPIVNTGPLGFGGRIGGPQEFQHGGVVDGPLGSPQIIKAHAGETVLPTHNPTFNRQMLSDTDSFRNVRMTAPVIPSQNLNVSMSGGFDIKGGQSAGKEAVSTAIDEMTESFRIAIDRLARRN